MAASLRASLMPDLSDRTNVALMADFRGRRPLSRFAETLGKPPKADKNVIASTNCRWPRFREIRLGQIDNFSLDTYDFGLPFLGSG
jgi:hypothetical protein